MKVTNVSPRALSLPALGKIVAPGESVEVPSPVGEGLIAQSDVWSGESPRPEPAKAAPKKAAKSTNKKGGA